MKSHLNVWWSKLGCIASCIKTMFSHRKTLFSSVCVCVCVRARARSCGLSCDIIYTNGELCRLYYSLPVWITSHFTISSLYCTSFHWTTLQTILPSDILYSLHFIIKLWILTKNYIFLKPWNDRDIYQLYLYPLTHIISHHIIYFHSMDPHRITKSIWI